MTFIFILALIILISGAFILILGRETVLEMIFGPADLGRFVFKPLKRSRAPHDALICPDRFCDDAKPDAVAPEFECSADELRETFRIELQQENRLERVHINDPAMRERYIQRSELFRFPDTIQVEYIPLAGNRSSIALYSRSQIGYSDAGVNLRRLKRWLKRLEQATN